MKKAVALVLSVLVIVSFSSALTLNLDIDLFGGDDSGTDKKTKKKSEKGEEENNTYGKRVGGQSVHTGTRDNDPKERRNSQDYQITEKDTNEKNDLSEAIKSFLRNLFGK